MGGFDRIYRICCGKNGTRTNTDERGLVDFVPQAFVNSAVSVCLGRVGGVGEGKRPLFYRRKVYCLLHGVAVDGAHTALGK